jgi:hypothetical protein
MVPITIVQFALRKFLLLNLMKVKSEAQTCTRCAVTQYIVKIVQTNP